MTEFKGIEVSRGIVQPEWIDYNGHMNVAYYVLAFDRAVDEFWEQLGITSEYVEAARGSTFAVENHVTWQRELNQSEPYLVTTQILAYDEKRIHQFQRMYHVEQKFLAATAEWMNLHVDLGSRKVTAWPEFVLAKLEYHSAQQAGMPLPPEVGQRMTVKDPLYAATDADA